MKQYMKGMDRGYVVCIEATREDLDALDRNGFPAIAVVYKVRDAIAAQLPAPLEIPENLGAVVEDAEGRLFVRVYPRNEGRTEGSEDTLSWQRVGNRNTCLMRSELNAVRVLSEGVKP